MPDAPSDEQAEFRDPLLVAVYDAECPWSREDDWFADAAGPPGRVLDLGCGTGRLALGLAAAGHTVTGVDPAPASLAAARAKPGADRVTWVHGTSADVPAGPFDAAVMTSHVAQLIADDAAFARTLADLRRALAPGGRLAFDTRDPDARGWEAWNPEASRHRVELPDGTTATVHAQVLAVDGGAVTSRAHYAFADGRRRTTTATFRFRTEAEIRAALHTAGFRIERIDGGWSGEPVGRGDGELLVRAVNPGGDPTR